MSETIKATKDFALENVIVTAVQIPGVKVDREKFLADVFAKEKKLALIMEKGPVEAGISREKLFKLANKQIIKRTSQSSIASFVAGIPGGLAMAATIPADILQFFGMALRLAQELAYLYGGEDMWNDGVIDDEKVKSRLILYCGVMFGVSGAVSGLRLLSVQLAKTALNRLPKIALTKGIIYPIVKKIAKAISIKMTKTIFANGISKAIPVIGGVISGGLNFASMMPMANRLLKALDDAYFDYSDDELQYDLKVMKDIELDENDITEVESEKQDGVAADNSSDVFALLEKLAKLRDMNAITTEDFEAKKSELLARI